MKPAARIVVIEDAAPAGTWAVTEPVRTPANDNAPAPAYPMDFCMNCGQLYELVAGLCGTCRARAAR